MLHLRLICPAERTDEVVELLTRSVGVAHLVMIRGAAVRPPGDMVSDAADAAEEAAPGQGADAVVWEELVARTGDDSRLTVGFQIFLTIACLLAAIGAITDSPVTVVGAMVRTGSRVRSTATRRRRLQGTFPRGQRPLHGDPGHRPSFGALCRTRSTPPRQPRSPRPHTGATVAVPGRTFAEHLRLGVGLIRRYGAAEPTVICALLRLLAAALHTTGQQSQRWEAIETEAALLLAAAERDTGVRRSHRRPHRHRRASPGAETARELS